MKKYLALTAAFLLPFAPTLAQDTNQTPVGEVLDFLSKGSNWIVAPYAIYDTGTKQVGGGLGIGYKVSNFLVPTLRLDYLDKQIFMPSGNLQLQLPIHLSTTVTLTPFAFTGIATPISGVGDLNGSAVGLFGTGAAVRFGDHFGVLADVEKWTSFPGQQIRAGIYYKF